MQDDKTRRDVARRWLALFEVPCLGAVGGAIGLVIGFFGAAYAVDLIAGPIAMFPAAIAGGLAGLLLGIWIALRIMAR